MLHPHRLNDGIQVRLAAHRECATPVRCHCHQPRGGDSTALPADHMIPAFANARRRVYLTATLADDSILVTDLNADPGMLRPVTPGSAADLGDRMILAPVALNRNLDDEAVRILARQFADGDRDGDGVRGRPAGQRRGARAQP